MADEQLYGEAGVEADQGFVPMAEVTTPESESSGDSPVTDWQKRREAEGEQRLHTVERNYVAVGGENAGEPMPDNQTVSIERATRDLTNIREYEAQQAQAEVDQRLAAEVDQLRHPFAAQAPIQQAEHEQKQEAPQIEQQVETAPEIPGADPDLVKLLTENPKLQTALQAEAEKAEAARLAYQNGLQTNAVAAWATMFAEFPELTNITPHEFPAVMRVLAENNPQRAQAIASKLQAVNAIAGHWQQAAAQQRQRLEADYRQQWAAWTREEDAKFDQLVPQMKDEKVKAEVGRAAVKTLRGAGFSDEDLMRAWHGDASLSLRDHRAQIILMKAALYDEAQATAPQKVRRPVPPVQRPGVSRDRSDYADDQVASLRARLAKSGDVRDAARLLLAQRAARGG
jgi:hypothetical protein